MVAPQQVDSLRVLQLEEQQQCQYLDIEGSPIDIVSEEEVLLQGRGAVGFEDIEQIIELSTWLMLYPWISPTTMVGDEMESILGYRSEIRGKLLKIKDTFLIKSFIKSRWSMPFFFSYSVTYGILFITEIFLLSSFIRLYYSILIDIP